MDISASSCMVYLDRFVLDVVFLGSILSVVIAYV